MTGKIQLHPDSDVVRTYVARKKEGIGLVSCESYIREENNLNWYVRDCDEVMLSKLEVVGMAIVKEAKTRKRRTSGLRKEYTDSMSRIRLELIGKGHGKG